MKSNYKAPTLNSPSFTCPHCWVLSQHNWDTGYRSPVNSEFVKIFVSKCLNFDCHNRTIWVDGEMVFPDTVTAELAHEDMPEEVKKIYNEARGVYTRSKRAAAALLRVALEKLTETLGETKGTLYKRIGNLKSQGLPEKVIQALDSVRITANDGGAHSGTIDLNNRDNTEIVNRLFFMVNFIVEKTMTENKQIDDHFLNLPDEKLKGIKDRDSNLS